MPERTRPADPMHIVFLAQCYAPEEVGAAILITELATDLVRRGHRVTVVTGAPSYPQGRVFPGYRNPLFSVERIDGVRVVRTWSFITPSKTFWPRALHYLTYSATAFYGGLLGRRPDVLVCYSPPLTLGISAWALASVWRVPWVLQIEDLYPDAAVAAGVLRNRAAIAALTRLERWLYRNATHVSVIAESFQRAVSSKGVPSAKLSLIPVWADPALVRPMPRENAFRARHGLEGKFVVLYAGNLGHTSCLEDVLDAADLLRDVEDVRFVLVGEGVKRPALEAAARARGLGNVAFLGFVPREEFPQLMAAGDVGLVTLHRAASLTSLPSKVFNVMSSGRPVLAVAPPESDLAALVTRAGCGAAVPPGDACSLAGTIRALRADPRELESMGLRGRAELESRFSRGRCVAAHERMLSELRGAARGVPAAARDGWT